MKHKKNLQILQWVGAIETWETKAELAKLSIKKQKNSVKKRISQQSTETTYKRNIFKVYIW